jgi:hypothetical protein
LHQPRRFPAPLPLRAIVSLCCLGAAIFTLPCRATERRGTRAPSAYLEVRGASVHRDAALGGTAGDVHDATFETPRALAWGLEAGQLPLHLRCVGSVGWGIGAHYLHHESVKKSGTKVEAKTVYQAVPAHGVLVAQLDGPSRCSAFPLVPFGKVGAAAAYWSLRKGQYGNEKDADAYESQSVGSGTLGGAMWAAGVRLDLGNGTGLDPGASAGVKNAYLFVEHARMGLRAGQSSLDLAWWTGGVAMQW